MYFFSGRDSIAFKTFSKESVISKGVRSSALEVQEWYELGFKDDGSSQPLQLRKRTKSLDH